MTQSGHGSGSLGITTGGFSIQKYDILFIPDVVLGAGKAMRRREVIRLCSSIAVAWPLTARAPSAMPVGRFLCAGTPADDPQRVAM
ncbi:MAG TPA: hypothetical protein VG759_01235 [Candidatus Angelobacter sp.]|nr:hypothetical protein [Candidatus Angelobacter sp.]